MTQVSRRRFLRAAGLTAAGAPVLVACASQKPRTSAERSPAAGSRRFPDGFQWGAATSAYQVEGAAHEDGRGPSVWDTFSQSSGRVAGGDTGEVAADHYHRYVQDLDLMERLGLRSYLLSISWSRVLPAGKGTVNRKGVDFYRRLVDGLRDRDIEPVATLWHWDTPQGLQDTGGWEARDTALRFGDYAEVVYDALGDDVGTYLTLNEPKTVPNVGYRYGVHAPGKRSERAASVATHHMLLAHGLATQARAAAGLRAAIGPALDLHPTYPSDSSAEAKAAAVLQDGFENRLYLDPIFRGTYPADALETIDGEALRGVVRAGDLKVISTPVDVLAVNYYTPVVVDGDRRPVERYETAHPADWLRIYPGPVRRAHARRPRLRQGSPPHDHRVRAPHRDRPLRGPDGTYDDADRITFLRDHLVEAHRAVQAGVNLVGFQVWSLMDNFEWAEGYEQRWGIVHVDYESGKRTPKRSAEWYSGVIAANAV